MFNRQTAPPVHRIDDTGLTPQAGARQRVPLEEQHMPPLNSRGQHAASVAAPAETTQTHQSLQPPEPGFSREVTLTGDYHAFSEPVRTVKFREPTAKDIAQCGNPFKFIFKALPNGDAMLDDVVVDWAKLVKCVHLLSVPPLPPSTVEKFNFTDLDACGEELAPFFMARSAFRTS